MEPDEKEVGRPAATPHRTQPDHYNTSFADASRAAQGQWQWILNSMGIHLPTENRHAPCPGCGGKDRFRWELNDDGGIFWICSQGDGDTIHGDGFDLVQHCLNVSARDSLDLVTRALGMDNGTNVVLHPRHPKAAKRVTVNPARVSAACHHVWNEAKPADGHPYLELKKLDPLGLRRSSRWFRKDPNPAIAKPRPLNGDWLLIQRLEMHGLGLQVVNLQAISSDGRIKLPFPYSTTKGQFGFAGLGMPCDKHPRRGKKNLVCITEGFATGASLVMAGICEPAVIAFTASNLPSVGVLVRRAYPDARIVFAADHDEAGLKFAHQAAAESGGRVIAPDVEGEDWSDVYLRGGEMFCE